MFNPGETVCHQFNIPFIADELTKVIATYKQGDDVVFEKAITSGFEAIGPNKTKFLIALSQEESLLFKDIHDYTVQLNVLISSSGSEMRATSKPLKGKSGVQYHREVIENE